MTPELSFPTELTNFDILALASISSELSNNGASEIIFTINSNGYVSLFFTMPYEDSVYNTYFTVDILPRYYNKPSLFLKEVIHFD